ncbi:unnamed protein product [Arabidopsis thaliana]|uniref:Uncharacterized protein n=2 Tax=Arabidopsis thaliana TaxID=3702 RepID=A0A1P8BHY2_ARATH|nr:uncharacterized protein AT5G27065 [Arabidopsis thaliana]ANM71207.1 hypothetical protein AT5G27065 [Arabidopsis thaliana]VYS68049.1 unnamed protein product [Arabidopsis thaliana]|eukprot:NP_001332752.1 hypothetical protein AT5G27065 [Arabidopsis thaliana]
MVKRKEGNVPVKALSLASKSIKLDSEVILGGSVPVNLLLESDKSDNPVKFSRTLGKFPLSLLSSTYKRVSWFRLPKEDGISPTKLLLKRPRKVESGEIRKISN